MEAAVRWSPQSQDGRFLVVDIADPNIVLYQVRALGQKQIEHEPIARCERLQNFNAFDWSKSDESIVALGLVSGNTSLYQLRLDKKTSSEPIHTFKIKQQRKCNAVTFSTQNWLAVALDKTRSDVCLNLYDLNSNVGQDPVRKLCNAEAVSSVKFFPDQPQELVAALQRSFVRLYDLRDGYFSAGGSLQASTRQVNNITIDPLDGNYFASAGSTDDPSVNVWDRRWLAQSPSTSYGNASQSNAVFEFRPAVDNSVRSTVWSMRYSGQTRGRLAICSSTGEVRVFDTAEHSMAQSEYTGPMPHNPHGGSNWTSSQYVSKSRLLEYPAHHPLKGRKSSQRVIAFDWLSSTNSTRNQAMIVLRPDREVELLHASMRPPLAEITARDDMAISYDDLSLTEAPQKPVASTQRASLQGRDGISGAQDVQTSHSALEPELDLDGRLTFGLSEVSQLLSSMGVQRERCLRGYLFDCQKNREVLAETPRLVALWRTIMRFQHLAENDGMIFESLDLSYLGVTALWTERPGNNPNRNLSNGLSKPTHMSDAIVGLNVEKGLPAFEGERTAYPEHRQLCLAACGWKFTIEDLEAECYELIERGRYYLAIVQAVLHDHRHLALNIIRTLVRSKTIPNIGLGPLLACETLNHEQKEMCLWMAADTEDSALKALLTYLVDGDWKSVMKTDYLNLTYRVGLGLKYLIDTELSNYIQSETARVIKNGDLQGVLLVGLGERSMDLFQTYITRTNDLQTAVLATAFTNPLYVDDVRWEMWKETYFQQMQVWRAFVPRAKFTVQHNRMATTRSGQTLVAVPARQITLRCNHCQSSIARHEAPPTRAPGPAANAGTVCPQCGRHMPRCAICMLWLGTPDPAIAGGAKDLERQEEIMASFVTFCASCGHGFHAHHAMGWFKKHGMCPVPACTCLCDLQ